MFEDYVCSECGRVHEACRCGEIIEPPKKKTIKAKFAPDGITLTLTLLKMYIEDESTLFDSDAEKYALYDYISYLQIDPSKVEPILNQWTTEFGIDLISFEDWREDCSQIVSVMKKQDFFKKKLLTQYRLGNGKTGLGVYDKVKEEFHEVNLGEHFIKVKSLLLKNYPDYLLLNNKTIREVIDKELILKLDEDTTDELEQFIKDKFELINSMGVKHVKINKISSSEKK